MRIVRWLSGGVLFAGLTAGTLSDVPRMHPPIFADGYRVLAADFHVHSFPLNWATFSPWDTVLEARRQGLDAIAMTPHNHIWVAQAGRWFSRLVGGPTVLVGEEIVTPQYHLLAVGIEKTISWRQPAANAIDELHKQGGVAIAAHPTKFYWLGYDAAAVSKLDGAEVLHPLAYENARQYGELQEFYGRARLAAIGDSDFHGLGPLGLCRTLVFATEDSERAIVEAVRARRTVVYDRDGRAYGDAGLIRLAAQDPRIRELASAPASTSQGLLATLSRACGILGLLGVFLFGFGWPRAGG
jgi:hypothetical protein